MHKSSKVTRNQDIEPLIQLYNFDNFSHSRKFNRLKSDFLFSKIIDLMILTSIDYFILNIFPFQGLSVYHIRNIII